MSQNPSDIMDFPAREEARTSFGPPVVVEAGAGTGKTAVLVSRIVTWTMGLGWRHAATALPGSPPQRIAERVWQRIVAITFTEAAAAEMDERVRRALADVSELRSAPGIHPEGFDLSQDETRARAQHLLHAVDHLNATTIHSFAHRMLREHPRQAGIHPEFVVDATLELTETVARDVLQKFVRASFSDEIDGAAQQLAAMGFGPPQIENELFTLLRSGVRPDWIAQPPYPPDRTAPFLESTRQAIADLRSHLQVFDAEGQPPGWAKKQRHEAATRAYEYAASSARALSSDVDFRAACSALRKLDPKVRERIADWAKGKVTGKEETLLSDRKGPLMETCQQVLKLVARFRHYNPEVLERAQPILHDLLSAVSEQCHREGFLSFSDLLRYGHRLFEQNEDLCESFRQGCDLLLVDEFQDTDPIQYEMVRLLALQGDTRPSLFLVGDPKQSIYGWRQADLLAYEQFKDELPDGSRTLSLFVNFRSVPPILAEVERVIGQVMHEERGIQPAFEALKACPALAEHAGLVAGGRGSVEIWLSHGSGTVDAAREREAEAISADIEDLARNHGMPFGASAILLRTKSSMPIYLSALERRGIPARVKGDRSFYRRREVIEASFLARAALEPNDRLALLGWLRSPSVGLPDAVLPNLWRAGLPQVMARHREATPLAVEDLRQLIRAAEANFLPTTEGLAHLPHWRELFLAGARALFELRRRWDHDSVDAFVQGLRETLHPDLLAAVRYLGKIRYRSLDRFYEQILDQLTQGNCDEDQVLRSIKKAIAGTRIEEIDLPPEDDDADSVRIMTIHNAKGLDFQNLYLPDLSRKPKSMHDLSARAAPPREGPRYRLCGIQSIDDWEIEAHTKVVEEAEAIRLLYVATTRAKHRMVLLGLPKPHGGLANTWAFKHILQGSSYEAFCAAESGHDRSVDFEWRAEDAPTLRWRRLPAVTPFAPPIPSDAQQPAEATEIARCAEHFKDLIAQANRRMEHPWLTAMSKADPMELEAIPALGVTEEEDHSFAEVAFTRSHHRGDAQRLGEIVHRVLERVDLKIPPAAAIIGALDQAFQAPSAIDAATASADRLWIEQLLLPPESHPLMTRFFALGDHLLARELTVVLNPTTDVEVPPALLGRIDFLYRDPTDGSFVVGDWKTEAWDEALTDERARAHELTGRLYTEAVRKAFQLKTPPRFELWMLTHGRIVTLSP